MGLKFLHKNYLSIFLQQVVENHGILPTHFETIFSMDLESDADLQNSGTANILKHIILNESPRLKFVKFYSKQSS